MNKKFLLLAILMLIICTKTFAYDSGFIYMLNAIGISETNVNGLKINEEIYNKYKLLVYGSPSIVNNTLQRWKNTSYGLWTKENHAWNGIGSRGEYFILGQDFLGKVVHNEKFPDDYTSGTSPLNWNYRVVKDALESWNNPFLYKYNIQKEYMMTQKLSRFGITYDLTATNIGLDKVRVQNYATWGNDGSVYTEKPGEGNIYWIATFTVPKMAGNAKLNSILDLPLGNNYVIEPDQDIIEIPIEFGAYVDGLSEYAKAEHIKIIEAELKANGENIGTISGSRKIKITKDGSLIINKNDYKNQKEIKINLECNSFLDTYFENDPLLYASKSSQIIIQIKGENKKVKIENDLESPTIYNIKIERVSKNDVVELYTTKNDKYNFICSGQVIKITVKTSVDARDVSVDFAGDTSIMTLDELTKRFEWEEPKERKEQMRYKSLEQLKRAYKFPKELSLDKKTETSKTFSVIYVIPYGTKQTLHSWNSLREISRDAFDIDETRLFTKKSDPYKLFIKAENVQGVTTSTIALHVAERWDELYNRDLSKYIK